MFLGRAGTRYGDLAAGALRHWPRVWGGDDEDVKGR